MCTDGAGCNPHFPVYGKKQLEAKIIKIAAELFPFVHTNNTACVELLTLRTKLADAVWHWALVTFNLQKMENAVVEIMDCINRSIRSYAGTSEQYIHYLAHSLKQEITRANAEFNTFTFAVIPLPENKRRKWKQLCSDASHYGKDIEHPETQAWLAKRTGYAVSEIAQLMEWDRRSKVKSAYTMADDGEEISIFDTDGFICI